MSLTHGESWRDAFAWPWKDISEEASEGRSKPPERDLPMIENHLACTFLIFFRFIGFMALRDRIVTCLSSFKKYWKKHLER